MTGRGARLLLASSMFVMGACGIVYEYALSVLGNYLIGSSHEEIFVIIGLMMFSMGVGSLLQRRLRVHLFDTFLLLEILLGLVGGYAATTVYFTFAVSESYRVVLYGFACAIGMLIGMEIPVLIRINKVYASSLRTNLSEILSMDYVGSLVGALLFAYVLLTRVGLTRIGFILGLTNASVAAVGFFVLRRQLRRPRLVGGCLLVTAALLILGFARAPDWAAWAEQRFFEDPVVHRETSRYQHLVLTQRDQRINLYLNGHLQLSSVDEAIYHELLVHPPMTLATSRKRVLILGGGDGLAVREVLRYPDVESVTLVDIDPAVVELARTHPALVALNDGALSDARVDTLAGDGIAPGPEQRVTIHSQRSTQRLSGQLHEVARVQVIHVDADIFLRAVEGTYDVVLVDFPDPQSIEIAKLYSRDFYEALRLRVSATGLVSVQSTSPFHARKVFLCIGETLRAAGFSAVPYHDNVPSFGEWGFHLATPRRDAADRLRERMRSIDELAIATRYVTPEVIAATTVFGKGWLARPGEIEPSSKMHPVLIHYHRDAWKNY